MSTLSTAQQTAIWSLVEHMDLPSGLGTEESACSIAAINLALTGTLSDEIPLCMSEVIGKWVIPIQDCMPDAIRNSHRWKSLLPLAAGTGREREHERLDIIMDWMWGKVLPVLQPMADDGGFGDEWMAMTARRTEAAAKVVDPADAAASYAAADAAFAAGAAWASAYAAAKVASYAAADAAFAAGTAAAYAASAKKKAAAWAAAEAARVAGYAAQASDTDAWTIFDPCDLLDRLIRVEE